MAGCVMFAATRGDRRVTRALIASVVGLLLAQASVGEARERIVVETKGSSIAGSVTLRLKNVVDKPYLSLPSPDRPRASWVSFRGTDLSVRVPKGLAARIEQAARSGDLKVTTGIGGWGHGLFRLTAGTGEKQVVLQRTRFSIGTEALLVQLGEGTTPFWMARATVKANTSPGRVRGASGASYRGGATLLDADTLGTDLRPARVGELRWFSKPAPRTTLLRYFDEAGSEGGAERPAVLLGPGQAASGPPADEQRARSVVAARPADKASRASRVVTRGPMSPESFDPHALLASKGLDPRQLKLVPTFGTPSSGLSIYYRGKQIGYYSRDTFHRSMDLDEKFHGKGIGTVAYLVMAKLFHDSRQGLLDSDLSAERAGKGNLSPQAQAVWRRFCETGFAEARRSGGYTVYRFKQSAIDRVSWDRFVAFLTPGQP